MSTAKTELNRFKIGDIIYSNGAPEDVWIVFNIKSGDYYLKPINFDASKRYSSSDGILYPFGSLHLGFELHEKYLKKKQFDLEMKEIING